MYNPAIEICKFLKLKTNLPKITYWPVIQDKDDQTHIVIQNFWKVIKCFDIRHRVNIKIIWNCNDEYPELRDYINIIKECLLSTCDHQPNILYNNLSKIIETWDERELIHPNNNRKIITIDLYIYTKQ